MLLVDDGGLNETVPVTVPHEAVYWLASSGGSVATSRESQR